MKKATKNQMREFKHLETMSDKNIDTQDIPEISDWHGATVGKFYRPIKKTVTLRLDADVLAWLREKHKRYQTEINSILRKHMQSRR